MKGLRYLPGHGGHRPAMIQLGCQHALLYMTGKQSKQRQNQQQDQRKSCVFHGNNCQNRNDPAGIRRHADDAGGEQGLHRIHITGKRAATSRDSGPPACLRAAALISATFPSGGRESSSAQTTPAVLPGREERMLQHKASKIEKHGKERQRHAAGQPVDDPRQQQRRDQRHDHRCRHYTQQRSRCQPPDESGRRFSQRQTRLSYASSCCSSCLAFIKSSICRNRSHQLPMGADCGLSVFHEDHLLHLRKWYSWWK